jgi:hypothetical protein
MIIIRTGVRRRVTTGDNFWPIFGLFVALKKRVPLLHPLFRCHPELSPDASKMGFFQLTPADCEIQQLLPYSTTYDTS